MGGSIEKTHSLVRLEVFSDAVTAVAMTILVLDLKPPEISTAIAANRFDFGFLRHHAPKFIAFFVSFFVIATGWTALVAVFRRASRATLPMIWLTLWHLFLTCLVPWAAAFWSEHPLLPQAVTIYLALWTVLIANGAVLQRHLWRTFQPGDVTEAFRSRFNVGMSILMIILTVLSAAVSVHVGFASVVVVTLLYLAPTDALRRAAVALGAASRRPEPPAVADPE
jgi:uncharacterized membrane protein